jgi:hypothetical protein
LSPFESLQLVQALRASPALYAAVETVHILGFTLLVGAVVLFDLRVLGLSRAIPVRALARHLLPWALVALLAIIPTGLAMFSAHADLFLGSRVFQLKMALILAAAMNAAIFHTGPFTSSRDWDVNAPAPLGARACAAISITLWVAILACGRFLALLRETA